MRFQQCPAMSDSVRHERPTSSPPPPLHVVNSTNGCKDALNRHDRVPEEEIAKRLDRAPSRQEHRSQYRRRACSAKCRNLCDLSSNLPILSFGESNGLPDWFRSQVQQRPPRKKKAVHFIWQCVGTPIGPFWKTLMCRSIAVGSPASQLKYPAARAAATLGAQLVP